MITVQILSNVDRVDPDDWCRPLYLTPEASGEVLTRSAYGGFAQKHTKWARVRHVLGNHWWGKMVHQINTNLGQYEFMRDTNGNLPESHRLNMGAYNLMNEQS